MVPHDIVGGSPHDHASLILAYPLYHSALCLIEAFPTDRCIMEVVGDSIYSLKKGMERRWLPLVVLVKQFLAEPETFRRLCEKLLVVVPETGLCLLYTSDAADELSDV